MEPYWQDNCRTIYCKDCRDMSELPDGSVQCVVTSPPFWGLRKYAGNQDLVWGDNHCEHEWGNTVRHRSSGGPQVPDNKWKSNISVVEGQRDTMSNTCSLCGAWKGSLGLEPTPEMYVSHIVEIFQQVRRVLRNDGVAFVNIGDSYASGKGSCFNPGGGKSSLEGHTHLKEQGAYPLNRGNKSTLESQGLKPKDLCLIPFRLAIALQSDGWWVISVIIWNKPNPMPESTKGRPTESHEYILMLTKNAAKPLYWTHRDLPGTRVRPKADYRWVNELTTEEVDTAPPNWKDKITCPQCGGTGRGNREIGWYVKDEECLKCAGKGKIRLWQRINLWKGHDYYWDVDAVREEATWSSIPNKRYRSHAPNGSERPGGNRKLSKPNPSGRNIRTVWEFPTRSFKEAHFAVFPEKLPELCIKAATPEAGCCSECGAPWARVIRKTGHINKREPAHVPNNSPTKVDSTGWAPTTVATNEWRPSCSCNAPVVPAIVLDPFSGAGTTLLVAAKLNRMAIGYDISEEYCALAVKRNSQGTL